MSTQDYQAAIKAHGTPIMPPQATDPKTAQDWMTWRRGGLDATDFFNKYGVAPQDMRDPLPTPKQAAAQKVIGAGQEAGTSQDIQDAWWMAHKWSPPLLGDFLAGPEAGAKMAWQ